MIEAKFIADSISPLGIRLTSVQATIHRFVLAELNTHRAFSRNSASSRAIPYAKTREKVLTNPAIPASWPAEQKGMQGGEELSESDSMRSKEEWLWAARGAVYSADHLHTRGVHKSVCNRLLEPFLWHTVLISATDWDNFFQQRCSPLAQPEIRIAAEKIREAMDNSKPRELRYDEWHLPYITQDELDNPELGINTLKEVSVARSARVSYETQEGVRDIEKDIALYERLCLADPPHWSPMEHVAKPAVNQVYYGNFFGWFQLRKQFGG